jgi:DNA helicase HerA-like ATPase
MNSVILATSGAGKSFTVKLEALRYLLNGIDVIIIDPENEYKELCEKVG